MCKNRQDVMDPEPGTTGWGTAGMPWGAADSTAGESREIRSRGMGACRWRPSRTSNTSSTTSLLLGSSLQVHQERGHNGAEGGHRDTEVTLAGQ